MSSESKKEKEVVTQIGEDSGAIVERPLEEKKKDALVKEEMREGVE